MKVFRSNVVAAMFAALFVFANPSALGCPDDDPY